MKLKGLLQEQCGPAEKKVEMNLFWKLVLLCDEQVKSIIDHVEGQIIQLQNVMQYHEDSWKRPRNLVQRGTPKPNITTTTTHKKYWKNYTLSPCDLIKKHIISCD